MKFRKLIFGSAIALALAASFAFRAEKQVTSVSIFDPTYLPIKHCVTLLLPQQPTCATTNTGPQCTAYYNATYPSNPAFSDVFPSCTNPVYRR